MENIPALLSHTFGLKLKLKHWIAGFLAIILTAVLSYFCLGTNQDISTDHPGGSYLEIAFWITALGSAVMAYLVMELLFRSRESRILAPLPIKPESLFFYQMKRIFKGIAISTLPVAGFWLPHIQTQPVIILSCLLLWPAGMAICASVSSAIILYAGNHASSEQQHQGSVAAMAFSSAPAIALGVSLMLVLLLKLLAEALLKTGFADAALTAAAITAAGFVIAFVYACHLYKTRYYAILAMFIDTDLIVINADYAFLDDTEAKKIRSADSVEKALQISFINQYQRRYSVHTLFIGVTAVILVLVSWGMPDYLAGVFLPMLAAVPVLSVSKPWLALQSHELKTGLMDTLPVTAKQAHRANLMTCIAIVSRHALWMTLAVLAAIWLQISLTSAIWQSLLTAVLCLTFSIGLSWLSLRFPKYAAAATGFISLLLAVMAFVLGSF